MAHASSGRRRASGDESDDRLLHMFLDVLRSSLFRIAADFPDHDDGVRIRILIEEAKGVNEVSADDRISTDPDAGRLADAELGELSHRFVGKGAGARDDADVARLVNLTGHDADLAFPG